MPSISEVIGEDRRLRQRTTTKVESSKYWGSFWAETYADCFDCKGIVKITQADLGMLKRINNLLEEISLYDFIPWVMLNWSDVSDTIGASFGLERTPRKAHIGFLLKYADTAIECYRDTRNQIQRQKSNTITRVIEKEDVFESHIFKDY